MAKYGSSRGDLLFKHSETLELARRFWSRPSSRSASISPRLSCFTKA